MKSFALKSFLFFLFSLQGYSQELLPFVENYSKYIYQGDNQIWNVVRGKDHAMYFANNHYFLRYDGVKWEKYNLPNKTIIRSVLAVGDKIYCGSYKEFGYWRRQQGKMIYVSISNGIKLFSDNGNEEIWKIFTFENKIYFQSFNEIYLFDNGKISAIKLPFQISYCFEINGELLYASIKNGIYKMKGTRFEKLPHMEAIENNVIHGIENFKGKTYIFTQKNGVFVIDKGIIAPWSHPLNEVLKTAIINTAKFIKANKLIIGTASKGIFSIDLNDNSYINISRDNVLMNNSILSIGFDNENDLWLGLDNGIAHIEINSPVSIFSDNSGKLGSVYSVAAIPEGYLLASNHGIFKYENKVLTLLPNAQGQAWNINKVDQRYIIGHNEGTFLYENNVLSKINAVNGGWNLSKSNLNATYLQANYSGVVIYNNSNDFSQYTQIQDFYKPIKYVAQKKINEIWAADNYRGLYKVVYDKNYKAIEIENVTQKNKIANDFGVKIFEYRNEVLFLINNSWYTFNSITNLLEKNAVFNANFKDISDIVAIDDNNFLILQSGLLYLIRADENKFVWNVIQEKYYRGKIINDYLKVFRSEGQYLLNLDDGFISLQLKKENKLFPIVHVEAFNENQLLRNRSKIKYNTELELRILSGLYGSTKPNLFYKAKDSNNFIPVKEGPLLLNNLSSGSHDILIYFNDGIKFHQLYQFEFKVARPWYFSLLMIFFYILVLLTAGYLYYKWNKIRYNQKLTLREEELKHQKKILEMELKAENEMNLQEYEKHILELEIQTKSSEVAGKSLSIAKQSEMIENIQLILESETDLNRLISEIKKAIKINAVNKHEWEIFENNLNQIHNEFIINLSNKFPILTSKDIKLCVYLKMNLSSKEIAPLMNISYRGVELHRYRLRKKLGLNQEENLNKFMLLV
ncbi:MAG: histidine kinase [Arcicella sp.]|nr:histidine kinase [Arcicella sp.]